MENEQFKNTLNYKRIDYLLDKKVTVYVMAYMAALTLGYHFKSADVNYTLYSWLGTYLLLTLSRFALVKFYHSNKTRYSHTKWEIAYTVNSLLVGFIWSVPTFLFIGSPAIGMDIQLVYLAVLCGVASGSIIGNASSSVSTVSMLSSTLVPTSYYFYFSNLEMGKTIAGLLFLYYVALTVFSFKLNKFIKENITLNLQNTNLIKDLKHSSQKLVESEKQAVQSSKLAALGEMASGIAHEINNPLTILSGNLRNIDRYLDKPNSKDKINDMIKKCHISIQRITKIIRGLKKMSRDGSDDDFETITLSQITEDIESLIHEKFKVNGVSFTINNTCPNEQIFAQPIQVSQILLNLLNNSYHAIEDSPSPWIELRIEKSFSNVLISVTDSGTGISQEVEDKIFTPFFTTKEVGKGTGLGLSISKDIAIKHGGQLFIDRTESNTCFKLRLPLQKAMAA